MRAAMRRRPLDGFHAFCGSAAAAGSPRAHNERHQRDAASSDYGDPSWDNQMLLRLAARMQAEDGVAVKDRYYHLRLYRKCFVGSEAVDWLLRKRVAHTAGEAVRLGDALLKLGVVAHVKHQHSFEDSYLFYRFREPGSWPALRAEHVSGAGDGASNGAQLLTPATVRHVDLAHQDLARQKQQERQMRARSRLAGLARVSPFIVALSAVLYDAQARLPLLAAALLLAACAVAAMMRRAPITRRQANEGEQTGCLRPHSSGNQPGGSQGSWREQQDTEQVAGPLQPAVTAARTPSAADFRGWPDRPCMLRLTPGVNQRLLGSLDPSRIPLHTSTPIRVESELFEGTVRVWVKGLTTSPADVFAGRRRRSHITVQGRFRAPLSYDDVLTGQSFERLTNLPARWFVDNVLLRTARAVNPSVTFGPLSAPSMLVPAVAMSQAVQVSERGSEPAVSAEEHEDMRLAGRAFADTTGAPKSAAWRKRFLQKAENRRSCIFDPSKVYTFHMFQHLVDLAAYQLLVSLYRFDMAYYLAGQPLRVMMQDRSGRPLFSLDIFHEMLMHAA